MYIVFDTETTDLGKSMICDIKKHPYMIQFSGVKLNKDLEKIDELTFFCKPDIEIPIHIQKLTNITNDTIKNEKKFENYISILNSFFKDAEVIVAHNLPFDKYILEIEYKRNDTECLLFQHKRLIDTISRTIALEGYRLNLDLLYEKLFHFKPQQANKRHSANYDTEILTECFKKLMKENYIKI